MEVKELLIKFQEYQLNYNVLNANFTHNAVANKFMERYNIENVTIPIIESKCSLYNQMTDCDIFRFRKYKPCVNCAHKQSI